MAFPTTGILDDFTTDEDPISEGGVWTGPLYTTHSQLRKVSGQLAREATGAAWGSSYLAADYGPECEAYMTIATADAAHEMTLHVKMSPIGDTTMDGYSFDYFRGSTVNGLYRYDNGAGTQLGSLFTQVWSNGDAVGVEYLAGNIAVYRKPAAGAWGQLATRGETTYQSQSGKTAVVIEGTTYRMDDLGGGTLVARFLEAQAAQASSAAMVGRACRGVYG